MSNSAIASRIQKLLAQVNPSVDITDPIIKDLVVNFVSNVLAEVETRVVTIQNKFNSSILSTMTDAELNSFAYSSRGLVKNPGTYATGYVFVMTTQLSVDIQIPAGTLFSTSDGSWQFSSISDINILAEDVPNYYNPIKSMYEFRVPVQAISPGVDYNITSYRITSLRTPLTFSALVENREPTTSGSDPESRADFITRIQMAGAGFSINSENALRQQILTTLIDVKDVQFYKPHKDANTVEVYYIGALPKEDVITFTIPEDENLVFTFPSDMVPIRSVDSVIYNGNQLEASQFAFSKWAMAIYLDTVDVGKEVYALVQYNSLSNDLKNFFFNTSDIHQTTWIPIEATPIEIKVKAYVKLPSYLMGDEASDLVMDSLLNTINTNFFVDSLSGDYLAQVLKENSSSILDARVVINDLPFISFKTGEYPSLLRSNIEVKVI